MYPNGFDPEEASREKDYAVTVGGKGAVVGWNWDLAGTYGKDLMNIYTLNSGNRDLFKLNGTSPVNFYDGTFLASQLTTTLDLNVAFGGEWRRDTYSISAGQPESYFGGGAQSYPGFSPADAGSYSRKNYAGYVDFNLKPIEGMTVDIAGRHEHFEDFGSTNIGKLTARYDFTPAFALRGTVSKGFRAPTLAEEHYTTVNVGPNTAFIQIQPNSAAAAAVGLGSGLKPEKSNNYSLGIVFRPVDRLIGTLDIYQIDIKDRIVGSGTLLGAVSGNVISQAVVNAALLSGASIDQVRDTGINLFANGIDTRTRGADFTLAYPVDYSFGHVDWSVGATYNSTTVTKAVSSLPNVPGQPLFDAVAISDLTTASPKFVLNLGALWTYDKFSINLREQIYGAASEWVNDNADTCGLPTNSPLYTNNPVYGNVAGICAANGGAALDYKDEIGVTPITNLELGFQPMPGVKLTAGALNLFNRYPNGTNKTLLAVYNALNDNSAVTIYPGFSPYGINGGYYYARAVFTF
jgi:iron complex outermembrane receptor protein